MITRSLRRGPSLDEQLGALEEALVFAEGRLDPEVVERGREVLARAGDRLRLGSELTVVALAGATGSGKSSLFNALAGTELSAVGVRRPTTGGVHAAVWGEDGAGPLLDWLGAARRHHLEDRALDGLVLLDLPDHDSTDTSHRLEVDRLVELVDLLAWVVDPQKYADAALHHGYLRRLAAYAPVTLVVMNHVDTLDADGRAACAADLRRLLESDGLGDVPVLSTSARTGEGIDELRNVLARRVAAKAAAVQRLAADAGTVAAGLEACCTAEDSAREVGRADRALLLDALADAAGIEAVAAAVARAHRHRSSLATGWPLTRWLRRLRPDPLRRFHLDLPGTEAGSSSLPPATPVQRARIDSALRAVGDAASAHLPDPWPGILRAAATRSVAELPRDLDRAVTGTDLGMARRPRWWAMAGALQIVLLLVAGAGALWLAGLFGLAWLQLPEPPLPEVGSVPLPTVMLLGGLFAGFVLAALSRLLASSGGRRRAARARRRLRDAVAEVADRRVLAAVGIELEAHDRICTALRRASRGR